MFLLLLLTGEYRTHGCSSIKNNILKQNNCIQDFLSLWKGSVGAANKGTFSQSMWFSLQAHTWL